MSMEEPLSVDARRQRMLDMRSAHLQRRKERFASIAKDSYTDSGFDANIDDRTQQQNVGTANIETTSTNISQAAMPETEAVVQYYTYSSVQAAAANENQSDNVHKRLMQLGADHETLTSRKNSANESNNNQPELGLEAENVEMFSQPAARRQAPKPPVSSKQSQPWDQEPPQQPKSTDEADEQTQYATHPSDSPRSNSPHSGLGAIADDHNQPSSSSEQLGDSNLNSDSQSQTQGTSKVPPGLRVTPSGHLEDSSGNVYFDMSDRVAFAMRPAPRRAMIQCTIVREKSLFKSVFYCYLQVDKAFLINAKKSISSKTAHYEMSVTQDGFDKNCSGYLGKLRGNFIGTEFSIYDAGYNPEKKKNHDQDDDGVVQKTEEIKHSEGFTRSESNQNRLQAAGDTLLPLPPQTSKPAEGAIGTVVGGRREDVRRELGVILYEATFLASKGPRKMRVLIPKILSNNVAAVWRPLKPTDSLLANYRATCTDGMFLLENKAPRWNERVGAYVLNFGGRVTLPSVKNFQLVQAESPETVVLQFGRTGKDTFTMDYSYPLTLMQAFGICLSSLDSKLACD